MVETKSKVYVLLDSQNRITRCEGQYTLSNIQNLDEWTLIEEGTPCDRLNLAQSHYFSGGLYTMDGICRWIARRYAPLGPRYNAEHAKEEQP